MFSLSATMSPFFNHVSLPALSFPLKFHRRVTRALWNLNGAWSLPGYFFYILLPMGTKSCAPFLFIVYISGLPGLRSTHMATSSVLSLSWRSRSSTLLKEWVGSICLPSFLWIVSEINLYDVISERYCAKCFAVHLLTRLAKRVHVHQCDVYLPTFPHTKPPTPNLYHY